MEELVASPGQRGGEGEGRGAAGSSGAASAAGPSGAAGSAGAASSAGAAGASSSSHAGDEGDDFSGADFSGAAGDNYDVASSGFNNSDAGSVGEGGTERAAPSSSSRSSSSPAKNAPGHLQAAHVSNGSSEGGGEGSEHGGDEVGGEGGGGVELGGGDRDRDSGLSADEEPLRQRYMNDPLRVPTPRKRPPNRTRSLLHQPGLPRPPPPRPSGLQPPPPPPPCRPSLLNQGLTRSRSSARVSMPPIQHYDASAQLAAAEKLRAATVEKLRAAAADDVRSSGADDDGDDGLQSGRREEEVLGDDQQFLYKRKGPAHSVRWPNCSQYKGVSRERGKWRVVLDCITISSSLDTELEAAAAYSRAFEAKYGTGERDDEAADLRPAGAPFRHLQQLVERLPDGPLGLEADIISLCDVRNKFWRELARRKWRGGRAPTPEDLDSSVQQWTKGASPEQLSETLSSMWKDDDSLAAGAVGEILAEDVVDSWPFVEKVRNVSTSEGLAPRAGPSHDIRAELMTGSCPEGLTAGAFMIPVSAEADMLPVEAKFTGAKTELRPQITPDDSFGRDTRHTMMRLRSSILFHSDPSGALVIVALLLPSSCCIVQLAQAGVEVRRMFTPKKDMAYCSVSYHHQEEPLARAEVRLLRKMCIQGWQIIRLISINGPNDVSVAQSQVY